MSDQSCRRPSPSMPIDETKNKRLVIVVSQDKAAEIEALAKKDRRPLSAYVRNIIEDNCKEARDNKSS